MQIAMIGMSKSGKTTLLSALTRGRSEAPSGPSRQQLNVGVVKMPDDRLETLSSLFKPDKLVPAEVQFWDIPANPEGTSDDGGSIGGQSLNVLQNADALAHVVRAFDDPTVPYHHATIDPQRDAAAMQGDLILSDLAILERRRQRIDTSLKGAKGHERDLLLREVALVIRIQEGLGKDAPVRQQQVSSEEWGTLANFSLLTAKPLLVVFNVGEDALDTSLETLNGDHPGTGVMTASLCAKLELELTQLAPDDESEFRQSLGIGESGVGRVLRTCYSLLGLVSFFTFVSNEVRAWSVPHKLPAQKAAGKIHTDMERGFIRAEVIGIEDLVKCGSLAQAKRQGLVRLEGKTYPVEDGDVITFLFNV